MQVASDTGRIQDLVLIVGILPALFGSVSIPRAVQGETTHSVTPAAVRDRCALAPRPRSAGRLSLGQIAIGRNHRIA